MSHKLLITLNSEDELAKIENTGAEILANYGNSVLVSADDETDAEALAAQGFEVAELPGAPVKVASMAFAFSDALAAEASAPTTVDASRKTYYIVQFIGPIKGEWLQEVEAQGVKVQNSLPGFSALVGMLPTDVPKVEALPFVEAVTPYRPAMKVSPKLRNDTRSELGFHELAAFSADTLRPSQPTQIEIAIFPDTSSAEIASQIRDNDGLVINESPTKITAVVPPQLIAELAQEQGVQAILPHEFPQLHNNVARTIMDIPNNGDFGDLTLQGNNQLVGVADSGLDTGNAAAIHQDFVGRVASINSLPTSFSAAWAPYINGPVNTDDGPQDANSGHGTHVAGSVLGSGQAAVGAGSTTVPRGAAPQAQVYFQAVEQAVNWKSVAQLAAVGLTPPFLPWPPPSPGLYGLPDDLGNLFAPAYTAGARIHTNSWGAPVNGEYNGNAREVDAFLWNNRDMFVCFSAGNEGEETDGDGIIDPDSIGSPGTAKNCLTVGATENDRPSGSLPAPGVNGNWADVPLAGHVSDNVDGMAAFSSRGPTDDGRVKPDVVAPGTNILSTRSSLAVGNLWGPVTPASDPLNGLYVWSGGTSMATPLVAGAAALIRQHLVEQRGHHQNGVKPSGALIKAFLINGAERIPGQYTNEVPTAWPNNVAGFGRANLVGSITPNTLGQSLFADEPDYAVATGDMQTFEVNVVNTAEPLRATLVWTDAPAPAGTGGVINQLYLQIRQPDTTIINGDVTAFPVVSNNVQQIQINAPAAGTYQIRVRGVSVTQQSPGSSIGSAADPHQDFALVVSNAMGMSTQPVSIAQAIDTTGSMGFYGYMEPAKERASQLVNFLRTNDKVSVTEFSTRPTLPDARTPYALRLLGSFNPDWTDAHTAITALFSQGNTPIGAGLIEAWNQLSGEPAGRPKAIILLSDGFNNQPPPIPTALATIPNDVPIFAIALGPASNVATLNSIATSRPGGAYFAVESDEDIHILHDIYAQIQAMAAGASLIGLDSAEIGSGDESEREMDVEEGAEEASFTLTWPADQNIEEMEMIVIAPDGEEYDGRHAATLERIGRGLHLVRVAVPQPGTWTVMIRNRGSEGNVRYTLSGAVQAPLRLTADVVRQSEEAALIRALLFFGRKPFDDARVIVQITQPQLSREDVLREFGDEIKNIRLDERLLEPGLTEEQILALKLAVFAQQFREKEGGLYQRETIKIEMRPDGNGVWFAEVPVSAAGKADLQVIAQGELDGSRFQRVATQSVEVGGKPTEAQPKPKFTLGKIFHRRNRLWSYDIFGVEVLNQAGQVATPDDGVSVKLSLSQGNRSTPMQTLSYYSRGRYFICRMSKKSLHKGKNEIRIQLLVNGVIVELANGTVEIR